MISYYIGAFKPMYGDMLSLPHAHEWLSKIKQLAEATKR